MPLSIDQALRETAAEDGVNATQIAAKIGRSETSARQYLHGTTMPPADVLVILMREYPRFAERLGFRVADAA